MNTDEKVAYLQDVTGMADRAQCMQVLEAHNWDLDSAVQTILAVTDNGNGASDGLGLGARPRNGAGGWPGGAGSSMVGAGSSRPPAWTTRGNGAGDSRHGRAPGALPSRSFVFQILGLPFAILQSSAGLVGRAVGMGQFLAGRMLNFSLAMLGTVVNVVGGPGTAQVIGQQVRRQLQLQPGSTPGISEAALFLRRFEAEYGDAHPAFVDLPFSEAVRRAGSQFKFLFIYLHSADHLNTPRFCRGTLCSPGVVAFLDEHFVVWGGDVRGSEGFRMSAALKASTFPFCAVVTGSTGQRVALLQHLEGPRGPEALVAVLQRVLEEQGAVLAAARLDEEERALSRRLREEQDEAYQAALLADQERERKRQEEAAAAAAEAVEAERRRVAAVAAAAAAAAEAAEREQMLERRRVEKAAALGEEPEKGPGVTQVVVRLPSGVRLERRFPSSSHVQSLYDYVDSVGTLGLAKYSLLTNYPRTVYGPDTLGLSLAEAKLHPHASLFVQMEEE